MIEKHDRKFAIYKGSGVIRFNLVPAEIKRILLDKREGDTEQTTILKTNSKYAGVYVEMANGKSGNYDWENSKLQVKLGLPDISKILLSVRTGGKKSVKLVHDPNANKEGAGQFFKNISLNRMSSGNWMFEVNAFQRDESNKPQSIGTCKCAISDDEMITLSTLLQNAIPQIVGWHSSSK